MYPDDQVLSLMACSTEEYSLVRLPTSLNNFTVSGLAQGIVLQSHRHCRIGQLAKYHVSVASRDQKLEGWVNVADTYITITL